MFGRSGSSARLEFGVLRWKVTGVTGLGGAWMSAMEWRATACTNNSGVC